MRAIFWKEFKELSLVGLPLTVLAVPTGWAIGVLRIGDELLVALLVGAAVLGIVQGLLDRMRIGDTFLYHRPVARHRIALARTLAGALHVVIAATVLLLALRVHAIPLVSDPTWRYFAEPTVLTAGQIFLSVVAALAIWAAVRLGFSFRRISHILAYFFGYGILVWPFLGQEHAGPAVVFAVLMAVLCIAPLLARVRLRRVALCAIAAWIVLGLTALGRGGTGALLLEAYPSLGVDPEGGLAFFRDKGYGATFDPARHPSASSVSRNSLLLLARPSSRWIREPVGPTIFDRIDRMDRVRHGFGVRHPSSRTWADLPARWSWADDDGGRRSIVAPDGGRSWKVGRDARGIGRGVIHDPEAQRLLVIDASPVAAADPVHLIDLPPGEPRFFQVVSQRGPDGELHWGVVGVGALIRAYDLHTGEIVLDAAWDFSEQPLRHVSVAVRSRPPQLVLATRLARADATDIVFRVRTIEPDSVKVRDVVLKPTGVLENMIAFAAGGIAVLRPLPLNLGAYYSDVPAPGRAYYDPWRDLWFRGHKRAAWLLINLLVGVACARLAWSQARLRLARGARLWALLAFVLGPIGLIWMRIWVPKLYIERVAGVRRAVNLDAPWPEPVATGTEVFQCSSS